MVKYNRHSKHLADYVSVALYTIKRHTGKTPKLISVKGYTLAAGRGSTVYGICNQYRKRYALSIHMGTTGGKHYVPFEQVLLTLAHEMAHMVWFEEHNHKHYQLMCAILESWYPLLFVNYVDTSKGREQE